MHLVMFDIDGTLIQSNEFDGMLFVKAVSDVLGISISSNWEEYRHVTDAGILDESINVYEVTGDRDQIHRDVKARYVELTRQYIDKNNLEIKEIAGACSFISGLRTRENVRIAFATGSWEETAIMKLNTVGIETEGIAFASSSDETSRTMIMGLAQKRAGSEVMFEKKTYFGDGIWDREAAKYLSYRFIAIGNDAGHTVSINDYSNREQIYDLLGI